MHKNVVYIIQNKLNNKVYVGLTTQGSKQRFKEHICRFNRGDRNHKLYQAFKKYGLDNFTFQEHFYGFDKESLKQVEQTLIKDFNSYNNGYNMTIGGDTISEETKQKISGALINRKVTWAHKTRETRIANDSYGKFVTLINQFGMLQEVKNLKAFCKMNKIDYSNLYHYSKKNKFYQGYLILESSTTSRKA